MVVPRNCRICLLVRLIIPWRLLAWVEITRPVPVRRKRFLTPDLVFILGIWLSWERRYTQRAPPSPPEKHAGGKGTHPPPRQPSAGRRRPAYGRSIPDWQPPEGCS